MSLPSSKLLPIFCLIWTGISGCQNLANLSSQVTSGATATSPTQNTGDCPTEPATKLDPNNVKPIDLTEAITTESGIIRQGTAVGYSFEAESGQKINYKTGENICVWVYSPDNKILTSQDLPQTGTYLIQATILQGSQTFDLEMSLGTQQTLTAQSPPQPTASQTQPVSRPSPKEFIIDYYSTINQENYETAWNQYSASHRGNKTLHPDGYYTFTNWYQQVKSIAVQDVLVESQDSQNATVKADLYYTMNGGRSFPTSFRLFLIWSDTAQAWKIDRIDKL